LKSLKLKDLAEAIGLFALVASLIFVGLQLQQSQEIAIANQYRARVDNALEFKSTLLQSEIYWDVRRKLERGEAIDAVERRAQSYYVASYSDMWENLDYQYAHGFLPEEHWSATLREIEFAIQRSGFAEYWTNNQTTFRKSFVEAIGALIAEYLPSPL